MAHGFEHNQNYYGGDFTYTFNKPAYLPREFPRQALTFSSMRDVAMPSDKFIDTDKDNVFSSVKSSSVNKMFLYNRQEVKIDWERDWGLTTYASAKTERVAPIGDIALERLSDHCPAHPAVLSDHHASSMNRMRAARPGCAPRAFPDLSPRSPGVNRARRSSGREEQRGGDRGDAFPAAGKAEPLGGGGLDADQRAGHGRAQVPRHLLHIRDKLWPLAEDGDIRMQHAPAG